MKPEQRATIIGLGVDDLKRATTFYRDIFGWKLHSATTESISFLRLNGLLLSLYPVEELAKDAGVNPEGSGFQRFSLAYNTRSKEEVDKLFDAFRRAKVKIVKEPIDVFWGGYSGYISDPDGHLWEIAFNPFLELDQEGNVFSD